MVVDYSDDSIKTLEWDEHIRRRPGMYIGKLGDGTSRDDGIYIMLKEIVDNSIDEYAMGFGKSIEIYNSLGFVSDEPEETRQITRDVSKLVRRMKLPYLVKLKINSVRDQSLKTNTCGYFAVKFIYDRMRGIPFKVASGYSSVKGAELSIKKFKRKLISFGYV